MKLQRLFNMKPAELAFRGRQEVFKAVERLSDPQVKTMPACRFDRTATDAPMKALLRRRELAGEKAGEKAGDKYGDKGGEKGRENGDAAEIAAALQAYLQARMTDRFFAGLLDDWRDPVFAKRLTDEFGFRIDAVIARADAVCEGTFDLLGYEALSFGRPVNWHLDPVAGKESPRVHWSRIDCGATEQVGDCKVVWELNRHQWLLDLGQAWRLTGDEKYAAHFVEQVGHWMSRNPYATGINWNSALEVALRLMAWCWALCLFRGARALTPDRFEMMLGGIQRHAAFVQRNLSRYFSPNTHLTVEALGLYVAGTLLPELQGARRWKSTGRSVLLEQLPLQVPGGGVYFEQSTRYQYYTAETYLHFAILAERNNDPLPALVRERLAEMLGFLLDMRRPDGTVPQIGDNDGGSLCPLERRAADDYRGLFSTAAQWLNDSQLAWAAGSATPESLCLLGGKTATEALFTAAAPPASATMSHAEQRDYVAMRSGWDRDAHHLVFDTGPLGCDVSGGHGHADLLAVQCSAFGENYLVDPGTGCYAANPAWRQFFRSSAAHSTVLVDGLDQAETEGAFGWRERPGARLIAVEHNDERFYAAAEHDAYARLADPVIHRRRVWFLDSAFWLIVDDLFGAEHHQVDLRFQFAPMPVAQEPGGWIRARGQNSALLLKTFAVVPLEVDVVEGAEAPARGWFSPNYGRRTPAPALTVKTAGVLPLRLATVLYPLRDREASPPSVNPCQQAGQLSGLEMPDVTVPLPEFGVASDSDVHEAVSLP